MLEKRHANLAFYNESKRGDTPWQSYSDTAIRDLILDDQNKANLISSSFKFELVLDTHKPINKSLDTVFAKRNQNSTFRDEILTNSY